MSLVKYISGEKFPTLISVSGGVTVEVGDLLFLDNTSGLRDDGGSTASSKAYPLKYFRLSGSSLELNRSGVPNYFVGVALSDKAGKTGSSDFNINVATEGVFEIPIKPGRTVYVGNFASASGTTTSSNLFNQYVKRTTDINYALGIFVENKTSALNAFVSICSILSPRRL